MRWVGRAIAGGLVAISILAPADGAWAARRAPACPAARYLVTRGSLLPLAGDVTASAETVTLSEDGALSITPGCGTASRARWREGERGRRLIARWRGKECLGVPSGLPPPKRRPTERLVLAASVDPACRVLAGEVRFRGAARSFTATRSVCGDGRVDLAAGETCDGTRLPADAVCPGDARLAAASCLACTTDCRQRPRLVPVGDGDPSLALYGSGRFAVLTLPETEYRIWRAGRIEREQLAGATAGVYALLLDAFDFVMFVNDEDAPPAESEVYGVHWGVRSDTLGLGPDRPPFDLAAPFGSPARLQSVVILTDRAGLPGGPSLHEIMHRWANHTGELVPNGGAHWGWAGVGGQLGGWQPDTLVDLGAGLWDADGPAGTDWFGTVANGGNSLPYAPLELYLMGLAEAREVPPIVIADQPSEVTPSAGVFRAAAMRTVTVDDLIAVAGPRRPGPADAQRAFRTLVVLVTARVPPPDVLEQFDAAVERFARPADDGDPAFNFWEATGGRATMRMDGLFQTRRTGPAGVTNASVATSWTLAPAPIECGPPHLARAPAAR